MSTFDFLVVVPWKNVGVRETFTPEFNGIGKIIRESFSRE